MSASNFSIPGFQTTHKNPYSATVTHAIAKKCNSTRRNNDDTIFYQNIVVFTICQLSIVGVFVVHHRRHSQSKTILSVGRRGSDRASWRLTQIH
ncbi:hypothetical protein L596_006435 [Steinernema carpocapsae]|uniref:Uncharacterized protein n=1 Tax=Steinernema carpocapsae TaxID=34508 RepID=A0A4U8V2A6_STECR|nr:hypothetical protein L596_006435 [Steinernema carpocapsae]